MGCHDVGDVLSRRMQGARRNSALWVLFSQSAQVTWAGGAAEAERRGWEINAPAKRNTKSKIKARVPSTTNLCLCLCFLLIFFSAFGLASCLLLFFAYAQ